MIDIDSALYRMKAYSGLLLASTTHEQKDIGQDINNLIRWIEYARPRLGAITPGVDPYAQMQNRHGLGMNQNQTGGAPAPKPKSPDDDPDMPPEPKPAEPLPAEAPAEDKPVA